MWLNRHLVATLVVGLVLIGAAGLWLALANGDGSDAQREIGGALVAGVVIGGAIVAIEEIRGSRVAEREAKHWSDSNSQAWYRELDRELALVIQADLSRMEWIAVEFGDGHPDDNERTDLSGKAVGLAELCHAGVVSEALREYQRDRVALREVKLALGDHIDGRYHRIQ